MDDTVCFSVLNLFELTGTMIGSINWLDNRVFTL